MKKGLVFYSFKSHKTGYIETLFERLKAVALTSGFSLERGSLKDLRISVMNDRLQVVDALNDTDIRDYSVVYFELWYKSPAQALVASTYLRRHGVPFLSEELEKLIPMTKVGELGILSDADLPLPNSFTSSHKEILRAFKQQPPIPYPLIVKADDGYGGKCNFLVADYEELRGVLREHKDKTFVVQEFIPNDFDYRCIVLGGQIKFVLKRQRSGGGHLNNTSQGAEGTVCDISELTPQMQADVLKAAELIGRSSFAGVDLLVSNNGKGHYILEVNQTPQIEIGSNIETKMRIMTDHLKEIAR
jgi:glutathione synthase/RimK-type ligase-like ATP-grasp enzyme